MTDCSGKQVQGYFQPKNLIKVEIDFEDWELVDQTLNKRKSKKSGKFEYLVNFVGHNKNYTRWLNEEQYLKLKSSFPDRLKLEQDG